MNNTLLLLLVGAGVFLWYKNKTKRGHEVSLVRGYDAQTDICGPRTQMVCAYTSPEQVRNRMACVDNAALRQLYPESEFPDKFGKLKGTWVCCPSPGIDRGVCSR